MLNSDHTSTFQYTPAQHKQWENDLSGFMDYRRKIEAEYDHGLWGALNRNNEYQHTRRAAMQARMEAKIADPELRKKLIPDFPAGCRRVTPEGELRFAAEGRNEGTEKAAADGSAWVRRRISRGAAGLKNRSDRYPSGEFH